MQQFLKLVERWGSTIIVLLICGTSGLSPFAHATEYISAQKKYYAVNRAWDGGGEAASKTVEDLCKNADYSCSGSYNSDVWDAAYSTWRWKGRWSYTITDKITGESNSYSQDIGNLIHYGCPTTGGWKPDQYRRRCYREEPPVVPCELCDALTAPKVGNPIVVVGGIKYQAETDYRNARGTLEFTRTYRSDENRWFHNYQMVGVDHNDGESHSLKQDACEKALDGSFGNVKCYGYAGTSAAKSFTLKRGAGRRVVFSGDNMLPPKDFHDRITPVLNASGQKTGWNAHNASNNTTEFYNIHGQIISITDSNGLIKTFHYSDGTTPEGIVPKNLPPLLIRVEDSFGQSLSFRYNVDELVTAMIDPAGNEYTYEYDTYQNLSKVNYPGGASKTYVYSELVNTSNVLRLFSLTGIIDELGNRYATFTYDSDGQAKSTEHAGGVDKYSISYPNGSATTVIDPLNATHTYTHSIILGVRLRTGGSRPGAGGVGKVSTFINRDANGNLWLHTDYDGFLTVYTYDMVRNLETKREEGGGALQRTISTEWHATLRLPARVAEPLRITTFTYDANGNLLTKAVQATTDVNGSKGFTATTTGPARTWTYTYNSSGQILTQKGPRTDVTATTSYTYDDQGNISTITNAAGHTTTLSNYDVHGRPGRVTDPNGLVTNFSYTVRGWRESVSVGGNTTSYTYDAAGQVTGVSMPDGASLTYTYDAAHRLTGIADAVGNSVTYTLDGMGNRLEEQVKDAEGTLARQITRAYDPLNRLQQITGALQ